MSLTIFGFRSRCDFTEAGRCLLTVGACSVRIETLFKWRRFSCCNSDDIMLIFIVTHDVVVLISLKLDDLLVNLMLLLSVDVLVVFLVLQKMISHHVRR